MDMVFCVYAAMTIALLVLQLRDYLSGDERAPYIERKMMAPVSTFPGVAPGSGREPAVHYDRAA